MKSENQKPTLLSTLRELGCVIAGIFFPPLGIAAAIRLDASGTGHFTTYVLYVLPILGLAFILPFLPTWGSRIAIAVGYLIVELLFMFIVSFSLACAWYKSCL
jgi:hypothetical protein